MSLAIAQIYAARKFHRESMKKPAKQTVSGDGDEKINGGSFMEAHLSKGFMEAPAKSGGSRRFGRWFAGKPGMKKSSAKVSDPMTIE